MREEAVMKRLKNFLFLSATLLMLAQLAQADDPIQPQFKGADAKAVDTAKNLRLAQRFNESIELLLPIAKREPDYYRAMYQLALACAERAQSASKQPKDIENADKWFRMAIAQKEQLQAAGKPLDEYTIYNSYGWFLIENGRFKEAEASLLKGLAELDKLPSATSRQRVLNNLSLVYKRQGRFNEAADLSKKAIDLGSLTAQKNLIEIQQMAKSKN
ncbi:MAG: tetratricopeptide repeat protein [Moraxellaceae bacterium]|nr:MAG: tetratricopeptide repeat protein [Moraxellaceae bacterium]